MVLGAQLVQVMLPCYDNIDHLYLFVAGVTAKRCITKARESVAGMINVLPQGEVDS